jgi:hypothetical protein
MTKYRVQNSVVALLAFACSLLLITTADLSRPTSPLSAQSEDLPIDNKTQAFQIISSELNNGIIKLSLRNGYSKAINGFTIGGSDTSGIQVDFTSTDSVIVPGEVYKYKIPSQSIQSVSGDVANKLKLKILSVVFEDGTSDGDNRAAEQMKNRRRGEKVQLARIISLLNRALASSDSGTLDAIGRLKTQISSLAVTPENGQPAEIVGGLHHGKEDVLARIRALEEKQKVQSDIDIRQALLKIKEQFEKKAAKL